MLQALQALQVLALQALLRAFFAEDTVEVACERCEGTCATVAHRVSKLPRVLTLHLKRFDATASGAVRKRLDPVQPLPTLSLTPCAKADVAPPPALRPPPVVAAGARGGGGGPSGRVSARAGPGALWAASPGTASARA